MVKLTKGRTVVDPHPVRARVLEGFLRDNNLAASFGAELGVFRGQTTFHLIDALPDLHLVAVDKFEPYYQQNDLTKKWGTLHPETTYEVLCRRAKEYDGRLTLVKADTVAAINAMPGDILDWVFIDADHTYEGCYRDIAASMRVVKRGGWICGHDGTWSGVRQAHKELLGWPINIIGDSVWVWQL